jgi:hypothetical protein
MTRISPVAKPKLACGHTLEQHQQAGKIAEFIAETMELAHRFDFTDAELEAALTAGAIACAMRRHMPQIPSVVLAKATHSSILNEMSKLEDFHSAQRVSKDQQSN